jgi:predicted MFS family arabinose efflux permease
MKINLWSLTLGNFAIGTGAMIIPGMLNELTADLATTPAAIGVIISAFAMTICFGGPFFASWTSKIERRKLLTGALILYAITHFLAAVALGYGMLLAVRIVTAIGAGLFTAQAAATASLIVPPEQRGKAIGLAFLGWSLAAVFGMPLGAYLGAEIGWRPTIALVGVLSAGSAAWVWFQIPAKVFVAPMDRAAWKSLLTNKPLLLAISVTAVGAAGQFTAFSYMAVILKEFIGATPGTISVLFLLFGISAVTGTVIGARVMDRFGAAQVGLASMACMAVALMLWSLTRGSLTVTIVLLLLWGLGCFSFNGAQQVRLVDLAPHLASASVALNSSALYMGQAFGALAGGLIITTYSMEYLSIVGAILMLAAMAMSKVALGMANRQVLVPAA